MDPICITKFDMERIENILAEAGDFKGRDQLDLQELKEEILKGTIIEPEETPSDLITMNSKIRLKDTESGEEMIFSLVFPKDADIENGKLSVLSPIGTAILGYRVGDTIEWRVPAGKRKISVEEILYQPEAAGDYHL